MRDMIRELASLAGVCLDGRSLRPVAGGDIHRAYRVDSEHGPLFLKTNSPQHLEGLAAEARGLQALAATGAIRVPGVIAHGLAGGKACLLLQWLALGTPGPAAAGALGRGLAQLHRHGAGGFGFPDDNFIGSTPQPNGWMGDWTDFFRRRRLGYQLELAAGNGLGFLVPDGERLLDALDVLLDGHRPEPSLLHGDLWGGNWGSLADDEPVIFDPAAHYGDRECDLAMTRLFGGFGQLFYDAYEAAWPLPAGAERRCKLYQLYHVLNHANMFGGGYGREAHNRIKELISFIG